MLKLRNNELMIKLFGAIMYDVITCTGLAIYNMKSSSYLHMRCHLVVKNLMPCPNDCALEYDIMPIRTLLIIQLTGARCDWRYIWDSSILRSQRLSIRPIYNPQTPSRYWAGT